MFRLLLVVGAALLVKHVLVASSPSADSPALVLECGSSVAVPANISHYGRHVGGLYSPERAPQHRCQSRPEKKGPIYVHVIPDVWRAGCGAEVSEDGRRYSITVHVHYSPKSPVQQKETAHTLSCYYDTAASIADHHHRHEDTAAAESDLNKHGNPSTRQHRPIPTHVHARNSHTPTFEDKELRSLLDKGQISARFLKQDLSLPVPAFDEKEISTRSGNKHIPRGFNHDGAVFPGFDDEIPTRSDNKHIPRGFNHEGGALTGLEKETTSESYGRDPHRGLHYEDAYPGYHLKGDTLTGLDSKATDRAAAEWESGAGSRGYLSQGYLSHYRSSRLVNEVDERVMVPLHPDLRHSPLKLSKGSGRSNVRGMTSSASVLQLNLVDEDGGMTSVVYPGKQVALELHAAQHNTLGIPSVTSCRVTNPLDPSSMDNVATPPFSSHIMLHGCGEGSSVPRGSGFTQSRHGFTTPYFPVPAFWTLQRALIFSCDVIICSDVARCQQKCPPQRRKPLTAGLHDITILLESQVVTSCPSVDDANNADDVRWDKSSLLPECLPEGHNLHKPLPPPETDQNLTTGASGSAVNSHAFPVFWLAGNLHYIIIISLLVLLLLIFMVALFCKMAAMQRQARHCRKEARREARELADSVHQDQMTQTPRPLPRTPHARGHTPNRHSRQGGDGASINVLQLDEVHGAVSRCPSGAPHPVFDNRRNSLPTPPPVPHLRSHHHRPLPYDIPPNHDQQRQYRASISSEPAHSTPFHFETAAQHCSKLKSFQSSTTVEENSERHTTIIEIKSPSQREPLENGMTWSAPEHHHLATFTGGGGGGGVGVGGGERASTSGSNTLERGVVLGVNSLRRHLERENQQVPSQPRDRRPITAQQCESLSPAHTASPQLYYNTPAPCSEDSSLKELMLSSPSEGSITSPPPLGAGIRTTPHRGGRKGGFPLVINTMEETTRL